MHPWRRAASLFALLLLPALSGCRSHHYLVVQEGAALHAAPQGDEVLEQLPRYHHERLAAAPEADHGRIPVTYRGKAGWVDPAAVRVFDYLDPDVDGGEDRSEVLAQQLRSAQVESEGGEWSPDQREAVKKGEVAQGMTKGQVELAWGWPVTVEPGARSGGERWIYKERRQARVDRHADAATGCASSWDDPWCSCWHPGWRWGGCRLHRGGWTEVRLPVIEERRVEFDAAGRVTAIDVRRYLDPT